MSHSHQKRPIKRKHQEITNDGISKEFKIVFMHMLKYLKKNKNIMMRKIGDIKKTNATSSNETIQSLR